MPVVRSHKESLSYNPTVKPGKVQCNSDTENNDPRQDFAICDMDYPMSGTERASFRTKTGKRITPHHWAVYDFSRTIPCGKVTTYKDICCAIGGSPRSVGVALRNNPFAPYVPCHRVIASNLFIGGFFGEWGKNTKTATQCDRKISMLALEGVDFTKEGYLINDANVVWRG